MSLPPASALTITLIFTLGVVLAACGGAPPENAAILAPASVANVAESSAPSFSVSTGKGSAFSLAEHSGEVVVLYFSFPG